MKIGSHFVYPNKSFRLSLIKHFVWTFALYFRLPDSRAFSTYVLDEHLHSTWWNFRVKCYRRVNGGWMENSRQMARGFVGYVCRCVSIGEQKSNTCLANNWIHVNAARFSNRNVIKYSESIHHQAAAFNKLHNPLRNRWKLGNRIGN